MYCVVCKKSSSESTNALSNGQHYHQSCRDSLGSQLAKLESEIDSDRNEIREIESGLQNSKSFVGTLINFAFNAGDSETLKLRLRTLRGLLAIKERKYREEEKVLHHINDFLPTYPPDWRWRLAQIPARCAECGSTRNLHTHHKIPLSRGGSNKLDNLIRLCARHHAKIHGRPLADNGLLGSKATSVLQKRMQTARSAIDNGKDVEFLYAKPGEDYVKRRVSPTAIKSIDHKKNDGMTICLFGYCHLRKASRTFAFKRMKDVRLGN